MPLVAQERQNLPEPPLTPNEVREGTLRIEQAILGWETEKLLRETIRRMDEISERERALANREIEAEKVRTELATKETELEKKRADFFEEAYNTATKKPGFWCGVKKFFTLGLGKC